VNHFDLETQMQKFEVDDDLAALVERLAKPRPFENLSFNAALRRVLQGKELSRATEPDEIDRLLGEANAVSTREPKKAPSPSAAEWAASVPELKDRRGMTTWKAICDLLKIDTAGDSARRKLKNWVKLHRSKWPAVPDID
jgi:hypothetical protein